MMAHTVRIHPPKAGDEDWLASMIAPLLDDDADRLARALAAGPVSVAAGKDANEAAELVEVLKGFGAQAELVGPAPMVTAPRRSGPVAAHQTQPFDGRELRRMLQAQEPIQRGNTGPVLMPETRSARPIPPPLRPSASVPPVRASQPVDQLAPPRRSRMSTNPSQPAGPTPTTRTGSSLVIDEPPARDSGPTPPIRTSQPIPPQPSLAARMPPGSPPRHVNGGESLAPQLSDREAPRVERGDVPPWFPQMSIRPDSETAEHESGRSWLWLVLIMAAAGAAAWWLRSR